MSLSALVVPLYTPISYYFSSYLAKVRSLHTDLDISSILVIGGSGDYFEVADQVVMMDCYQCRDVTKKAKEIASKAGTKMISDVSFGVVPHRFPVGAAFTPTNKVAVRSVAMISYGDIEIDLTGLEQLVNKSQTTAISFALQLLSRIASKQQLSVRDICTQLDKTIDNNGLDALADGIFHGGFARPRSFEIAGAINRLRKEGTLVQK